MEILTVEKFGLAALDPLRAGQGLALGTVTIPAGSIANALVAASVALFDLPPESRRPAHLDGSHDVPLRRGHRRAVLFAIHFTVAAEHVRHVQLRAIHGPAAQQC